MRSIYGIFSSLSSIGHFSAILWGKKSCSHIWPPLLKQYLSCLWIAFRIVYNILFDSKSDCLYCFEKFASNLINEAKVVSNDWSVLSLQTLLSMARMRSKPLQSVYYSKSYISRHQSMSELALKLPFIQTIERFFQRKQTIFWNICISFSSPQYSSEWFTWMPSQMFVYFFCMFLN